jgi:hypothetical protein
VDRGDSGDLRGNEDSGEDFRMKAKMKLITKNKKPKRKVSKKRQLDKKCLDLWSKCVRARDLTCRGCNSDYKLSAHHVRSRTNLSTRYLLDNGICLCWKCHSLQKFNPERFQDLVIEIIGDEKYQELKRISLGDIQKHTDYDLEMIIEYLEGLLEDIKSGIPLGALHRMP